MTPNDLGNFLVLENCQKVQIQDVVEYIERQVKEVLRNSTIVLNNQEVGLVSSETNFNGHRPWFSCPGCHTKRSTLYKHPISGVLECRECVGLCYRKQRYKGVSLS